MFNRILCPIDFDGNSLEALRMARASPGRTERDFTFCMSCLPAIRWLYLLP